MSKKLRPAVTRLRPTKLPRLKALKCFSEVHKRVVNGVPFKEIARYVRNDEKEFTEFTEDWLIKLLSKYRRTLPPMSLLSTTMHSDVAKAQDTLYRGLDELDELANLYRLQKERIDIDFGTEKNIKKLFKTTGQEVFIAMRILKNMAELKMDLGISMRHLGKLEMESTNTTATLTADLTARYGKEEVSKVMADPSSRRKVLNLAERMLAIGRQASEEIREEAEAPEDAEVVVDAEPTASGG